MSKEVSYDASVVQELARRLYSNARRIEILYAAGGALALGSPLVSAYLFLGQLESLITGFGFGVSLGPGFGGWLLVLVLMAAGGWFGYETARTRTFQMRLRAQSALCQLEIERNTRRG